MYSNKTSKYQIPIIGNGEILDSTAESIIATIIENQIRAGVLGAGGNRVYREGTYLVEVDTQNRTTVTLTGNPSVQGVCNDGLVESFDAVIWSNIPAGGLYYLYLKSSTTTYVNPDQFQVIFSTSIETGNNFLLLASINTIGATPSNVPSVNTNPPQKASAFNLFELINSGSDPFGPALAQTALTILSRLTVFLSATETFLVSQNNTGANLPVISIQNQSSQPEIRSGQELRLADSRLTEGFALTDNANPEFIGVANSLIGALNEILSLLLNHLQTSTNPHGETLTQTNIILTNLMQVPQLIIRPPTISSPPTPPGSPPGSPPAPPGSPPGTTYLNTCDIKSFGRLKFCDDQGSITLTEDGQTEYLGASTSIIGSLNELFTLIVELRAELDSLLGLTIPAKSPIVLEVSPDEIGAPLHFRVELSEDDQFNTVVVEKDSRISNSNWFYERHVPVDSSPPPPTMNPPSPPRSPHSPLPFFNIPAATEPVWLPLPSNGLPGELQKRPDGKPVLVQYRPQPLDGLYLRRKYNVRAQQNNLEYGDITLGTIVFG